MLVQLHASVEMLFLVKRVESLFAFCINRSSELYYE